MTLDEATLILIRGVSGPNALEVARGAGVSSTTVERYLRGGQTPRAETLERIYLFVWRRLNATVLLDDAVDRTAGGRDRWEPDPATESSGSASL